MDDELRKAAETARKPQPLMIETYDWWENGHKMINAQLTEQGLERLEALELLARHYLATTREDDGEGVTPEWLLSVGFEDDEYCFRIKHKEDGWHDHMRYTQAAVRKLDWKWHANGIGVRGQKTRGDVRRLCDALGIELKEAGGGA